MLLYRDNLGGGANEVDEDGNICTMCTRLPDQKLVGRLFLSGQIRVYTMLSPLEETKICGSSQRMI